MPPTWTYDLGTDVGTVRLLISDVDIDHTPPAVPANAIFSDEEITALLAIEGDEVRLGAALALETIARNEVMVSKVIRVLDLQTDGAAVARELRLQAALLREQAADASYTDPDFEIAELVTDQFTWRDRIWNEALRDA